MSTLRATNIKNPDSGSNNIVLSEGGGVVISGVTTASSFVGNVTGDVTGNITGNATGDFTISSGNLVVGDGYGVDFSATANSSGTMSSELLDDYEEGTWTPANSVTTLTNLTTATYTKVGRFVYVNFDFTLATNASGSAIGITGLPFTAGSQCFGVIMSDNFNILNAFPFVASGSTTMQFQFSATSGGSRDTVAYSRIVSGGVVRGSLCYIV